jgi:hypothetical protein
MDMNHGFGTELAAGCMGRRVHGIELDLDNPAAVPQIDEDEATQVAAAMHPAIQVHLATNLVGADGPRR